jgi:hypothetical protein
MKKTLILFSLCILCLGTAMAWTPTMSHSDKLPRLSRDFLHKYFPTLTISGIEHKNADHCDMMIVSFKDGSTMIFDAKSGDCHAIMLKSGSIPDTLLSQRVIDQVNKSYPGVKITSLKRIKGGTCLGLSNNQRVCFDRDGKEIAAPTNKSCGCGKGADKK